MLVVLESDVAVGRYGLHAVECQIEQSVVCRPRTEQEPTVAVFFQQIGLYGPVLRLGIVEWLIADGYRLPVGDIVVERIEEL